MINDLNPWVDDIGQYEYDQNFKNEISNFVNNELCKLRKIYDQIEFSDDKQGRYYLGMIQAYENILNYITY